MRTSLAATLMIVAAAGTAQAQMTNAPIAGVKPKPVATTPIRPALQTPADTANAMAQAERQAIQSDLAWTGHFNGAITGEVSERMLGAIKAFQKDNGGKPTGVLNPQERGVLAAAARKAQDNVGWKLIADPVTGARLGLPTKLVPHAIGRRQWREMEFLHRHHPDPAVAPQGGRALHRQTRRAGEEGARRPQGRLQRGEAGFLRAVRDCRG